MDYQAFMDSVRADWQITLPYLLLYLFSSCADVLFGFVAAYVTKSLCSTVSRKGMLRKMLMVSTIMLAALFDGILPDLDATIMGMHMHLTFAAVGCVWWIVHELLSLVEHAAVIGLPIPERLKDALAIVQHEIDQPEPHTHQPKEPIDTP